MLLIYNDLENTLFPNLNEFCNSVCGIVKLDLFLFTLISYEQVSLMGYYLFQFAY